MRIQEAADELRKALRAMPLIVCSRETLRELDALAEWQEESVMSTPEQPAEVEPARRGEQDEGADQKLAERGAHYGILRAGSITQSQARQDF